MLFDDIPNDFEKRFDVVACFIVHEGTFLMLRRNQKKPNGGKWGLPAGKVDAGETLEVALLREVHEETGIAIDEQTLRYHGSVPVRHDSVDFEYHMFGVNITKRPPILLHGDEHEEHAWFTPADSLFITQVPDQAECTRRYFKL